MKYNFIGIIFKLTKSIIYEYLNLIKKNLIKKNIFDKIANAFNIIDIYNLTIITEPLKWLSYIQRDILFKVSCECIQSYEDIFPSNV